MSIHQHVLDEGACWLPQAVADIRPIQAAIEAVLQQAPLRHLKTRWGQSLSVAMSNCGTLGWHSDNRGYRYVPEDPLSGRPWPPMPAVLAELAQWLAMQAGYDDFVPDACLINQYLPGARMGLHQDRDEVDLNQPIVSVSLGLPATFLWGGATRAAPVRKLILSHADAVVWGGPSRLHFHGVGPLRPGHHPELGARRLNLTFRCAGS